MSLGLGSQTCVSVLGWGTVAATICFHCPPFLQSNYQTPKSLSEGGTREQVLLLCHPKSCPTLGLCPPLLDPAKCHKSFPVPASERQLLNFKYCKTQLAFPIKLPFYGIVWKLNTMNFIANLTFICNVYLLPGERGRVVCFLLCQTRKRYSMTLPITSTKKNQIYLPWLERVVFTGCLCTLQAVWDLPSS